MRKQPIFLALLLGVVLFSYQNCSNGMHADQSLQNLVESEKRDRSPEPDSGPLISMAVKGQTCPTSPPPLVLKWPLAGRPYVDWIISNYVDDDSTTGIKDYTGAAASEALTYDAHRGIDILVPSFRYMDNPTPVLAAAPGKVVKIIQNQPDHNTSCSSPDWNVVVLKHSDGSLAIYGHLKQNSVVVTMDQLVNTGEKLAEVGSSGCSSHPHLHFELAACSGATIDPMQTNLFTNPPLYTKTAPTSLMDVVMAQPTITSITQMISPGPANQTSFGMDTTFSVGMTVAAAKANDVLRMEFVDPTGVKIPLYFERTMTMRYTLSNWYWNMYFHKVGRWTALFKINGTIQQQRQFDIF